MTFSGLVLKSRQPSSARACHFYFSKTALILHHCDRIRHAIKGKLDLRVHNDILTVKSDFVLAFHSFTMLPEINKLAQLEHCKGATVSIDINPLNVDHKTFIPGHSTPRGVYLLDTLSQIFHD